MASGNGLGLRSVDTADGTIQATNQALHRLVALDVRPPDFSNFTAMIATFDGDSLYFLQFLSLYDAFVLAPWRQSILR